MKTLMLPALQRDYVPTLGDGVLEQEGVDGSARQRRQFDRVHIVSLAVAIEKPSDAQYFYGFWRFHTIKPQKFLWDLMCDDFQLQTYECQFIPKTVQVGPRNGKNYAISFSVRCKPLNNNQLEWDEQIIDLWEQTGNGFEFINLLDKTVNVHLPDAMRDVESFK